MKRPILNELSKKFSDGIVGTYTWFPEVGVSKVVDSFEPDKDMCRILTVYRARKDVYKVLVSNVETLYITIVRNETGFLEGAVVKSLREDILTTDDFLDTVQDAFNKKNSENLKKIQDFENELNSRFGIDLKRALELDRFIVRNKPNVNLERYLENQKNTP